MDLEEYIDKMLIKFNMQNSTVSPVPALASAVLSKDQCPRTEEEMKQMSKVPYRQLIGSLLYASTTLVPQISVAVSKLSEFLNYPGWIHWTEAKRVLRYLKGIKKEKLIYWKDNSSEKFTLNGYVDSDWGADRDT